MNFVALAWWLLAAESLCVQITSRLLYEGNGHEIKLEGEETGVDEDDDDTGNDVHHLQRRDVSP